MSSPAQPPLGQFVPLVAWVVNATFGGGSAILAAFQRELVERRRWLTSEQYGLCFAVARITPGTSILAFCAAIGWYFGRLPGAVLSLLAGSLPCAGLALGMLLVYEQLQDVPWFSISLRGAMAAAIGIMLAAGWNIVRPHLKRSLRARTLAILVISLLLMTGAGLSPVPILALAALFGFALPPRREKEQPS